MQLFKIVFIAVWAISTQHLVAQEIEAGLLACETADTPDLLAPPISNIEHYYKELIAKEGQNARYRASDLALQKYGCDKEEYSAKLYNLLAEEAFLMQNYEVAKLYYDKVLETEFVADYFAQGLVADRAKLTALVGLRNIAMQEEDYSTALIFHQSYVDSLEKNWRTIAAQNKLEHDKIFAKCYQALGQSEQAINYLMPYAFGAVAGTYGTIDKEAIDYLTDLLRTKYPKKIYKQFLNNIAMQIYSEEKGGKVLFFLQVLDNKIYFQNDSANYQYRVAENASLRGQAVAHYQRKLLNSYFYQSLFR
ncbi:MULTISPECIES: hypothetical protein [unclassified Aureispira]|uniref:hypothetical protein n=1 Tax=unclassified Aureispira TaxID=2649989 RepID=UPI0006962B56|nr:MULTISPECIES: hypothetical protein [unclassified Aureispira]WMX13897.1 hypothetical protein QP953_23880 [Aureispira sp. CCB-E]